MGVQPLSELTRAPEGSAAKASKPEVARPINAAAVPQLREEMQRRFDGAREILQQQEAHNAERGGNATQKYGQNEEARQQIDSINSILGGIDNLDPLKKSQGVQEGLMVLKREVNALNVDLVTVKEQIRQRPLEERQQYWAAWQKYLQEGDGEVKKQQYYDLQKHFPGMFPLQSRRLEITKAVTKDKKIISAVEPTV